MLKTADLYDFTACMAGEWLKGFLYPWEALDGIRGEIDSLGAMLPPEEYEQRGEHCWVAKDATVAPTAFLGEHVIIGHRTEVRHCAFVRECALVGDGCVVGNSTELKNVILFDGVQVPHFNYVGDSILGKGSHMGAGAVTSNIKSDKSLITIRDRQGNAIHTGLLKIGAMLGDGAEVGCNSVLCPGSIIGRGCIIYPTSCVRGVVPPHTIWKNKEQLVPVRSNITE